MGSYQGMRWFKCDFQVQTPEDSAHWADDNTRLPNPRIPVIPATIDPDGHQIQAGSDETKLQEIARRYLRRCHEAGLELIGVTDHNFSQRTEPREWFLTHLVEQNKSVAQEVGRAPLVILPGFEVDIGYHVLCLFAPARKAVHVWRVNKLLCKLGLDENERFKSGPVPLRRLEAYVSLKELIEVVQGRFKGIVIAAHADQNDGILQSSRNMGDYQNKGLLAFEVTSNPPSRRVMDIVEGRDRAWHREGKHPAYVMSSDAKSLKVDHNGKPLVNSIGYRSTWLKMSTPSIEALRQAFLGPASRIRLMETRPSDAQTHPRILRVEVKGAKFLQDQEIVFSEGLNCIIGGRGSGKSSLLEYLRFALISEEISEHGAVSAALERKRNNLKQSLSGQDAEVRITFQVDKGITDTLVYRPNAEPQNQRQIEGREVTDINTVLRQLRAQFFSQGELSHMTEEDGGQAQVLSIIDIASGSKLTEIQDTERKLQDKLRNLFQATSEKNRLIAAIRKAKQEEAELRRHLEARASLQDYAASNQLGRRATLYIAERVEEATSALQDVDALRGGLLRSSGPLPEDAKNWPAASWFSEIDEQLAEARRTFLEVLDKGTRAYEITVQSLLSDAALASPRAEIHATKVKFLNACEERGVAPEDITQLEELEQSRRRWAAQLDQLQEELGAVTTLADEFPETLNSLHENWAKQFEVRKETAAAIQNAVPSQTVKVKLRFMYDKTAFLKEWKRLQPRDGRAKLARYWEELGEDVFDSWEQRGTERTPWETVEAGRKDPRVILYFTGGLNGVSSDDLQPLLISHIDTPDARQIWEALRLTRISDGIDVELLREDGTLAGKMQGSLSEGQRNTVLLNLILARGSGPVIIDQPEDELDSSFIYKALVRDMRATKLKRQLIVVTHNANLPVNSDAELIYALEARDGLGKCVSQGGLDRTDVAKSVLDIMEGSEQAFKLRQEKYHF